MTTFYSIVMLQEEFSPEEKDFLSACMAAAHGLVEVVVQYMSQGGDIGRKLDC